MIKDIISQERELESTKIELTLKPEFNLLDAFRMIDTCNKGWVEFNELSERLCRTFDIDTLSVQGIENLRLLFKRYDTNHDNRISLAEFCRAFVPLGKEYAALVEGRSEFYSKRGMTPRDFFNSDTRRLIRNVWHTLLYTERALENIKLRLHKSQYFNGREAFKHCDKDHDGAISQGDLRDFLAEFGFFATEKELNLVMNRFS